MGASSSDTFCSQVGQYWESNDGKWMGWLVEDLREDKEINDQSSFAFPGREKRRDFLDSHWWWNDLEDTEWRWIYVATIHQAVASVRICWWHWEARQEWRETLKERRSDDAKAAVVALCLGEWFQVLPKARTAISADFLHLALSFNLRIVWYLISIKTQSQLECFFLFSALSWPLWLTVFNRICWTSRVVVHLWAQ